MKNNAIKLSLYINYFVFAILLNSVGIVILKSQNVYGVDELEASILEACKDLPIMIVSFVIASFLPRIGYKKGMLAALALVAVACVGMYFGNSFLTTKILFICVGVSFAVIKVSVYSAIGLVTNNESEHNSLMSNIEGFFMFGIALAYFLFPAFNSNTNPDAWLNVYWVLAGLSVLSFIFLSRAKFDEGNEIPGESIKEDILQMLRLMTKLLIVIFSISAFLFVMIEQGIMTWLPTFNQEAMNLPENIAVMMSSILAVSLGIGRILAGKLTKRFSWFSVLLVCILLAMAMVVFVLPKTLEVDSREISSLLDVPALRYAFPIVGLFIAPIYPLLNSVVLSALPKKLHSPMSGLIILFSALGGTLGSRFIGYLFKELGADQAFTYILIPMGLLLIALFLLKKLTSKQV